MASPSSAGAESVISQMLKDCASITECGLSLKTLVPFKDIDTVIDEEEEVAKQLDRNQLDYYDEKTATHSSGSSFDMKLGAPRSDLKKLQTDLLEQTWEQHLQHLFIRRIRMASSARAAVGSAENDLASLTVEALESRDLLADQVTKLQYELVGQVRERLETVSRQARIVQHENRTLWATLHSNQTVLAIANTHQQQTRARDDERKVANLIQHNQLLKYILADLITCTDYLYTDERIAQTLLKLAD